MGLLKGWNRSKGFPNRDAPGVDDGVENVVFGEEWISGSEDSRIDFTSGSENNINKSTRLKTQLKTIHNFSVVQKRSSKTSFREKSQKSLCKKSQRILLIFLQKFVH